MKYRKSNRSKRVSGGCANNSSCGVCRGDRLAANERALPADLLEQLSVPNRAPLLMLSIDDEWDCDSDCPLCGDPHEPSVEVGRVSASPTLMVPSLAYALVRAYTPALR